MSDPPTQPKGRLKEEKDLLSPVSKLTSLEVWLRTAMQIWDDSTLGRAEQVALNTVMSGVYCCWAMTQVSSIFFSTMLNGKHNPYLEKRKN